MALDEQARSAWAGAEPSVKGCKWARVDLFVKKTIRNNIETATMWGRSPNSFPGSCKGIGLRPRFSASMTKKILS
jgi:hypothetical protein